MLLFFVDIIKFKQKTKMKYNVQDDVTKSDMFWRLYYYYSYNTIVSHVKLSNGEINVHYAIGSSSSI